MEKICVFCGKKPQSKTDEHILPRWLIELTGDPNRQVMLGHVKAGEVRPRRFAFDRFVFPACEECNQRFSTLESAAKSIIIKILSGSALSAGELNTLLDWFDKVRIGLWLAHYYLDKNFAAIQPRFYIATRMGQHDRMVGIFKADCNLRGLTFMCTEAPYFYYSPTCFSLMINNYYFLNASYVFLFSRRLGLPFPNKIIADAEAPREFCQMCPGMERILSPLIRKPLRYSGTEIYQPMYPQFLNQPDAKEFYDTDYVRAMSAAAEKGQGKVFIQRDKKVMRYSSELSSEWLPTRVYSRRELHWGVPLMTFQLQDFLDEMSPLMDQLPKEEQRHWKRMQKIFKTFNTMSQRKCEKELKSG